MPSLFDKLFKKPEALAEELDQVLIGREYKEFPLSFDYGVSDFKKELVYKDYKDFDKARLENQLTIETLNIYHGYEGVEAGVFIFNTSSTPVELYNVNLALENSEGKLLARKTVDFKGDCRIEPNSSVFHEILFEDVVIEGEPKNIQVVFTNLFGMKISYTEEMDIESFMDENLPEATKEYLRDKLYEVPSIRSGELIVDPIVAVGGKDSITAMILIRNASKSNVTINSIPIKIYMKENIPIYIGEYTASENGIKIEENKGRLITVKIPNKYIYGNIVNGDLYTLKIK
ncbi:SLAP domain-containing protein [Clostridium sp. UBA1353]|uniref:SLAP domain-containing protein n=1 Tax=Clostridium sp. UBA1353 TaxID=1946347 RepID=UPI00321710E0